MSAKTGEQMELLGKQEPRAHARKTDPHTSHAAASSVTNLRRSQKAVYDCLLIYGPMHDKDLWRRYYKEMMGGHHNWPWLSESGVRTRRSELVDTGWVKDTGRTEKLESGRNATVWEANK